MKRETLDRLNAARRDQRPVVLAVDLASGETALFGADAGRDFHFAGADLQADIARALRDDKPGTIETADGEVFLNVFNPPRRMVIVGAVHIAQALAPMAAGLGYGVTIIDPRGAFADAERFTGVELSSDWPDEALQAMALDARTAVVTLTHDPKLDDAALSVALKSEAFYIGSLGSRKTHGARLGRLRRAGFGDADLARIHGPVGLDIGASSAAEIAVSIIAQVTRVLHGEAR